MSLVLNYNAILATLLMTSAAKVLQQLVLVAQTKVIGPLQAIHTGRLLAQSSVESAINTYLVLQRLQTTSDNSVGVAWLPKIQRCRRGCR